MSNTVNLWLHAITGATSTDAELVLALQRVKPRPVYMGDRRKGKQSHKQARRKALKVRAQKRAQKLGHR